jgi:phage-related protein
MSMSTKKIASDQITLTDLTDVSGTVIYYISQDSTLTPPVKPTVKEPNGWTTTEPSYTNGSDTSLYFANRTDWSNGEFTWSDVSTSSSYEAAKSAWEQSATTATKLTSYVASNDKAVADIQAQVDGSISTWFYSVDPSMTTEPTSDWTTEKLKNTHLGDLYYNTKDNTSWRFQKDGTTGVYSWTQLVDSVAQQALAAAAQAQDTADHKRRIFMTTPIVPYDVGDLWAEGSSGDIWRCIIAKTDKQVYASSDWEKASKYTSDARVEAFIAGTYASDISNLNTQIDQKAETWYQSTDPAAPWSTTALKASHIGDLWYKTTDQTTWRYDGTKWVQQNVPKAIFDDIDGKSQIFTATPTIPYYIGDLWVQGSTGDILNCATTRTSGSFLSSDWVISSKYTDDTAVNKLADVVNVNTGSITNLFNRFDAAYGTCTSAATDKNKIVTCDKFDLYSGVRIAVKFTYANLADSPTMNVNSTGDKPILVDGKALSTGDAKNWLPDVTVYFIYNGTQWEMINPSLSTLIRDSSQGTLVAKTGQPYGALTNANGSFDIVMLTWNDGVPTIGNRVLSTSTDGLKLYSLINEEMVNVASFGSTAQIGNSNGVHASIDTDSFDIVASTGNVIASLGGAMPMITLGNWRWYSRSNGGFTLGKV